MAKKAPQKQRKKTVSGKSGSKLKQTATVHAPPIIVGIGASAGGLEAFTQLLRALPADTGMAFVLMQHLEPKYDGVLTELLARATAMPVHEVRKGMHAQANHVYVIPADLRILHWLLHIIGPNRPAGRHLPIDYFFRWLAKAQGSKAIGVILSGTASDGTAGIKAIKDEGGITFAQDPESAKFDGMPRNAIASGCVDFILSPSFIGKELARIARNPSARLPPQTGPVVPAREEEWEHLFRLLQTSSGVDFSYYRKPTIKRRLSRRMAVHKIQRLGEYLKLLERNQQELDALFHEILISVTGFFRDPEVFFALRGKILPQILAAKPAGEPLRIWVPGCSAGEEAYSLEICVLEHLGKKAASTPIQIFGTDISDAAIEKARAGIYPEYALKEVSKERIQRFFHKIDGNYQVDEKLRELCVFARHDLTKDPPFSKIDLISCRNVLIYFEPPLQRKVLAFFHYALRSHGVLLLGKTESLSAYVDLFTIADNKHKFFLKNTAATVPLEVDRLAYGTSVPHGKLPKETAPSQDLEKEADRIVWERYAHAGLVVNNDLQILLVRGDTSPYLRLAPGRAAFQLLRMLREELVMELRAAVQKAHRTGRSVRREGIEVKQGQHLRTVNLEVRPLDFAGARDRNFLIFFEEAGPPTQAPSQPVAGKKGKNTGAQDVLRLRSELARAREYVQTIIRDQETTKEELRAANEEALSSMEELQSTNEELETAKEELQSSNEELVTLNEQLQNRNAELASRSDQLNNVFVASDIPILILGEDLRIRLFTPAAEKVLGLLPADIGRPIGKLRLGIPVPGLEELISTVVEKATEVRRELQSDDGRWYALHVRPFWTGEKKIEGVLLAFMDVHDIKQGQEALKKERNFIGAILDAAKDLLVVVLDRQGRIVHFNHVCQKLSGYSLQEVQGRRLWDFLLVPEEVESVQAVFREVLAGKPVQCENHWITKDGHRLLVSWSHSAVMEDGQVESVIKTGTDVTAREEARQRAQESEATVRALLESAAQAILACDKNGRIVLANSAAEKMYGYGRHELIGRRLESLLPERLREAHVLRRAAWFAEPRTTRVGLELAGLRKDGSEFPIEVGLSSADSREGSLGVAFVSDITTRKKTEQTLNEYKEQLQKLTGALISAQEAGNREVARELHDVFSQELAAVGMEISSLKEDARSGADLTGRLSDLGKKIARLAADIHRTSRELHPTVLEELGLEPALRQECESFQQRSGIPTQFTTKNVPAELRPEVALCVYRVAQESLRNVHKHAADADAVWVSLIGSPEGITLRIEDTGDGFDLNEALKKGGLGLISMEERVRLVNGKLTIQSQPGKGTTVTAFVPMEKKPA